MLAEGGRRWAGQWFLPVDISLYKRAKVSDGAGRDSFGGLSSQRRRTFVEIVASSPPRRPGASFSCADQPHMAATELTFARASKQRQQNPAVLSPCPCPASKMQVCCGRAAGVRTEAGAFAAMVAAAAAAVARGAHVAKAANVRPGARVGRVVGQASDASSAERVRQSGSGSACEPTGEACACEGHRSDEGGAPGGGGAAYKKRKLKKQRQDTETRKKAKEAAEAAEVAAAAVADADADLKTCLTQWHRR